MKEYMILKIDIINIPNPEESLNNLAKGGWEIISVIQSAANINILIYTFERLVIPKQNEA